MGVFNKKVSIIIVLAIILAVKTTWVTASATNEEVVKTYLADESGTMSSVDIWLNLDVNEVDWTICGVPYYPVSFVVKKSGLYLQKDNSFNATPYAFKLCSQRKCIDNVAIGTFDVSNYEVNWVWDDYVSVEFLILEENLPNSDAYKKGSIITPNILSMLEYAFDRKVEARVATANDIVEHYLSRNMAPIFVYEITSEIHN